jgi:hypothetical protein
MVWSSDLIWAAWRGMVAAVEWLMTCCRGACCAAEDGMGFADNLLHTLIDATRWTASSHHLPLPCPQPKLLFYRFFPLVCVFLFDVVVLFSTLPKPLIWASKSLSM